MMDNEKIAKIVLSIILDCKVKTLYSKPQETPIKYDNDIRMSRYDFKAVISTGVNEFSTVLIEIQKYKSGNPINRFRNYLADNYKKKEAIVNLNGETKNSSLPIITIYILGYDLPEFNCRAIRVDNKPYDIIGSKELSVESEFVNLLTHKSFILITADKEGVEIKNTRLEKFLNLFIQKIKGEEKNTIIEVDKNQYKDKELLNLVKYLNQAIQDEDILRGIDAEDDLLKDIYNLEEEMHAAKTIAIKQTKLAQDQQLKAEKERQRADKEMQRA
jgi:hypothetical protein